MYKKQRYGKRYRRFILALCYRMELRDPCRSRRRHRSKQETCGGHKAHGAVCPPPII